jgi:uncharacterized protein involved in exopolysaccharide biosynthesis
MNHEIQSARWDLPWADVAAAALRHRKLVLTLMLLAALTAWLAAFVSPPTYEARASLMLTTDRVDLKVSPNDNPVAQIERIDEMRGNSEAAWLRSESVLREVLAPWRAKIEAAQPSVGQRVVDLVTFPLRIPTWIYRQLHGMPLQSAFDQWATEIRDRLEVSPVRQSNVIEMAFADGTPQFAADVLNALIRHRIAGQTSFSQQDEAVSFYKEQAAVLAERVKVAENAVRDFYQREGIVGGPEEREALRGRLATVRGELGITETALSEARVRVTFLQEALQKLPRDVRTTAAGSGSMQEQVLQLMMERSKLLPRYAPTSVKILEIDRQIAEAKRLMQQEQRLVSAASTSANPTYLEVERNLIDAEATRVTLEARLAALREQEVGSLAQMQNLVNGTSNLERLELELSQAKDSHRTYVAKQESARFSSALDDSQILNISVTEWAQVPTIPEKARGAWYLLLGALAGFTAGAVVAYVWDRIDPRVKSSAEVGRLTGLPIIGEVSG